MPKPLQGWHAEDIKAEIRKRGKTLQDLSMDCGLHYSTCALAIHAKGNPRGEKAIADFLGVPLRTLWPARYNEDGSRNSTNYRPKHKRSAPPAERKINGAA